MSNSLSSSLPERDTNFKDQFLSRVKSVIGIGAAGPTALHEPRFVAPDWLYVKDCLDTGWVSSVGKYVDQFEESIRSFTGIPGVVATSSGTAALHISLILAGVKPGDEVLVPSLSFVATANAVKYLHAIPHFVDVDLETFGVCPIKLKNYLSSICDRKDGILVNGKTGRPIRALVVMHNLGHPVKLDELITLCNEFSFTMVEDAAEALGSTYKGAHVGNHGLLSCLSFNGNKIVTTGGGGAIMTHDLDLARRAKHLTTTAKLPHKWEFVHDELGYNYRLPNLNAALGCSQMTRLESMVLVKRALANKYIAELSQIEGVVPFREQSWVRSNYWLNGVCLTAEVVHLRDALLAEFHSNGIMVRPFWQLLHRLRYFSDSPRTDDLSNSESLERSFIKLPSSAHLGVRYT